MQLTSCGCSLSVKEGYGQECGTNGTSWPKAQAPQEQQKKINTSENWPKSDAGQASTASLNRSRYCNSENKHYSNHGTPDYHGSTLLSKMQLRDNSAALPSQFRTAARDSIPHVTKNCTMSSNFKILKAVTSRYYHVQCCISRTRLLTQISGCLMALISFWGPDLPGWCVTAKVTWALR